MQSISSPGASPPSVGIGIFREQAIFAGANAVAPDYTHPFHRFLQEVQGLGGGWTFSSLDLREGRPRKLVVVLDNGFLYKTGSVYRFPGTDQDVPPDKPNVLAYFRSLFSNAPILDCYDVLMYCADDHLSELVLRALTRNKRGSDSVPGYWVDAEKE